MILRPPRGFKGSLVKFFTPKARTEIWLLKPVPLPSGGGSPFFVGGFDGFGLAFDPPILTFETAFCSKKTSP